MILRAVLMPLFVFMAQACAGIAQQKPASPLLASPFPVLAVDSAVRARLIEEWAPTNRYQHERGYCVRYSTQVLTRPARTYVVYTLVAIVRAEETKGRQSSIGQVGCDDGPDITMLHIHPPFYCDRAEDGSSCSTWDPFAHQCFPSDTDYATLLESKRPFDLIQCDQWAITPYWR